jgi:hypothetical protein
MSFAARSRRRLASEARVIPVLVGGASMLDESELPESIRASPGTTPWSCRIGDGARTWDALVDVLEDETVAPSATCRSVASGRH